MKKIFFIIFFIFQLINISHAENKIVFLDINFDLTKSVKGKTILKRIYVFNKIIQFSVDTQTVLDEFGTDRANVYISRAPTGSITLQVDSNQTRPQRGDSFDLTIDGTTHTFFCTSVNISMSQSDFQKVSVEFRKRLTT